MRSLALILAAALSVSCGDDDDDRNGNGQDNSCDTENAQRCVGTVMETCLNGVWTTYMDCADTDLICEERGAGVAACAVDTSDCTHNGHAAAAALAFYDADLLPQYDVVTFNNMQTEGLEITFPNTVTPGEIELNQNSTLPGCTVCVLGLRDLSAPTPKYFLANDGTIDFSQIGTTEGSALTGTITGLKMRQVTLGGAGAADVPGGEIWCAQSVNINASILPYMCFFTDNPSETHDYVIGESRCFAGGKLANCVASPIGGAEDPGEWNYVDTCTNGCAETVPGQGACNP